MPVRISSDDAMPRSLTVIPVHPVPVMGDRDVRSPGGGGEMHTDPVCHMQVDPAAAAAVSQYDGQTYYFCCKGCKTKFDANPAQYLQPAPPAVPVAVPANAEWTCPMHPEIVRDKPG